MSNTKNLKQFRIDVVSEEDGERYEGQFTARKWAILDQSRINRRKAELGGGMVCVRDENGEPTGKGLDEFTDHLNYVIAVCETLLPQKPTWFDLETLSDTYILIKVFEEVMSFQNSFRGRGRTTNEESKGHGVSSQGSGGEESSQALPHNPPKKVVDKEVQASLEP